MMHFEKEKKNELPCKFFHCKENAKFIVVTLKINKSRMFVYILKIELSILIP